MKFLSLAIDAIKSYNPQIITPSTHIEQFCNNNIKLDEEKCAFIADIVLGLERYKLLVQILINGFYEKYKSQIISEDKHLYTILSYLFIIQPNIISQKILKSELIQEKTQHHMFHKLLNFLFNECLQTDWLSSQLCLIYDVDYVSNVLIKQMQNWKPFVESILDELEIDKKYTNKSFKIFKTKKKTKAKPFKFTETQRIKKKEVITPIKNDNNNSNNNSNSNSNINQPIISTTLAEIEMENDIRRKKVFEETQNRHLKARAPRLTKPRQKPYQQSPKRKIVANPIPKYPEPPQLNYTTADILRMDAIFRKRQEDEAAAIREYEFALRDASEFERWQEEERLKEEEEKRLRIEERRLELARAAIDAQEAVEKNIQQKTLEVQDMKDELAIRLAEKERLEAEALIRAKKKAAAIIQERQQVQEAKKCIIVDRKTRAKQLLHERKRREKIRERERKKEMKEKRKLIQQIQAMEKIATERARQVKVVNPSETSGMNLMNEMSLIELRERLVHLKLREERLLNDKREKIKRKRENQKRMLQAKLNRLEHIRSMQSMDALERRQQIVQPNRTSKLSKSEALKLARRISAQRNGKSKQKSIEIPTSLVSKLKRARRQIREQY